MGLIRQIQSILAIRSIAAGKHGRLSVAQVMLFMVNIKDAEANLSPQEFAKVEERYLDLLKDKDRELMDLTDFLAVALDVIKYFDYVAPYEKYSGGVEEDYPWLMSELKIHRERRREGI